MNDYGFYDDQRTNAEHFTLAGLTAYLKSKPPRRPKVVPTSSKMTDAERQNYNQARADYMSGGILIKTHEHLRALKELPKVFAHNRDPHGGSASLLVSGASTLGKTTVVKSLMKDVYSSYCRQFPDHGRYGRAPIVYVLVPPNCSGKLLMVAFANFFGLSTGDRETGDSIRLRVIAALKAAGTQLVVVDELQNLNAKNRGNGEAVDVLRNLHNQTRATYVYAGINIEDGELVKGERGLQLRARSAVLEMTRFNLSNPAHSADWRGLVSTFEKALPLADHEPGTLLELSTYLWERTNGSIGSLHRLLAFAAHDIIHSHGHLPELITRELLDAQTIDDAAEKEYAAKLARKKPAA